MYKVSSFGIPDAVQQNITKACPPLRVQKPVDWSELVEDADISMMQFLWVVKGGVLKLSSLTDSGSHQIRASEYQTLESELLHTVAWRCPALSIFSSVSFFFCKSESVILKKFKCDLHVKCEM